MRLRCALRALRAVAESRNTKSTSEALAFKRVVHHGTLLTLNMGYRHGTSPGENHYAFAARRMDRAPTGLAWNPGGVLSIISAKPPGKFAWAFCRTQAGEIQ